MNRTMVLPIVTLLAVMAGFLPAAQASEQAQPNPLGADTVVPSTSGPGISGWQHEHPQYSYANDAQLHTHNPPRTDDHPVAPTAVAPALPFGLPDDLRPRRRPERHINACINKYLFLSETADRGVDEWCFG